MTLHQNPIQTAGAPLDKARIAVVMVHGRGASAESILGLSRSFDRNDVAYLAPQASGSTWYPMSFLAPLSHNEPGISAGIEAVRRAVQTATDAGIDAERIVALGFSQGACLVSEFAARTPGRYGGIIAFSGGLIGNEERPYADPPVDKVFNYDGSMELTPVFFGCSDRDPHIPVERVHQSTEVFRQLGADVTERIYPGMPHIVNEDEIAFVQDLLDAIAAR